MKSNSIIIHSSLQKLTLCIFAAIYLLTGHTIAQEFGGNTPALKWRQIDTDTVRVIYPKSMQPQAQHVANTVHFLNRNTRQTIGGKQKKIDIVLQNQTLASNGYVGLAPFRSELYLNAPQSTFNLGGNWLNLLSIHEYRHALQYMNTRYGLTNVAAILTGQLGWSAFMGLSIPDWFLEGDAVVSETVLTAQGRGRIPSFFNGYKSLMMEDNIYNYQKARNGSIKDFVPNEYPLGYLLTSYGRIQYGNEFWKDVLRDAAAYRSIFYPFSSAIRKRTDLSISEFYNEAMGYYDSLWQNLETTGDAMQGRELTKNKKDKKGTFTSYEYPQVMQNGTLIMHKESYKQIGGFFTIDSLGQEELICRQGRVFDQYFTYRNGVLLWAEVGQDTRWSWQTYSNVVLYDLTSKKRHRITHQQKYLSPDMSYAGDKIAVITATPGLNYAVNIISPEDGRLIAQLPNDQQYYLSYPKWMSDDAHIIVLARDEYGRNGILKVSVNHGDVELLLPFTNHQIGIPYADGDFLYFSASFTGTDNIFGLHIPTGKVYQITDAPLGSYQVTIKNDILYFSRFTSLGNDIISKAMPASPMDDEAEIRPVEPIDLPTYGTVSGFSDAGDISNKIPGKAYDSKPYPIGSKLINIHSWSFLFTDPNYEWALRSNNLLNTLGMNLGARYNRNEQNLTYFFDASYAQYYPILTFAANVGQRNTRAAVVDQQGNVAGYRQINWWESALRPGIAVPFNLSSGLYARQLNLSGLYSFTRVNFDNTSESLSNSIRDFDYQSYTASLGFYNIRKKARQNIFSKYSQYLLLNYDQSIDGNTADQLFADAEFTFPGLADNHNLVFQASFQQEDPQAFPRFGDNFVYARGYNRPNYDQLFKIGSNYHFPVWYPDLGLWGISYIYRLRANVFFDYSRSYFVNNQTQAKSIQLYNSLGGELVSIPICSIIINLVLDFATATSP
ncbi:MAG: hypothetical protein HC819_13615 [Cyclobacteriaceae bacterium]|nr:hypothetical protein [Cyclobacteriaceae bacterium]